MAARLRRRNSSWLRWIRAAFVGIATLVGLLGLGFNPPWGAVAFGLIAAILTLAAVDLGILVAVFALGLPLLATAPVAGITFITLGIVLLRYLGANGGEAFFIVALALAGAAFGPVWAAAALAGFILGTTDGLLAAVLAAFTVEAFGVSLGRAALGATVTGGTQDLLRLAAMPPNLFASSWVSASLGSIQPDSVSSTLSVIAHPRSGALLLLQPVVWGCCAIIAATAGHAIKRSVRPYLSFLAPAAAALLPAASIALLAPLLGANVSVTAIASSALSSAVLAGAIAWAWERYFPVEVVEAAPRVAQRGIAAEDADVDELLSLIAAAEDRLATEHTINATVLITDMKSFSRMTEEEGSIITAKAIQRHRDLLLPVIETHGGHGKSTGGDGLVAAFDSPLDAVATAAAMQSVLAEHNQAHPEDRELSVRIGIATGEVVLDRRGRPFIGAALNLAARIMNLADGGQAFASSRVARAAQQTYPMHSHGTFEMKNIAEPVEVYEILWAEGQAPKAPGAAPTEM